MELSELLRSYVVSLSWFETRECSVFLPEIRNILRNPHHPTSSLSTLLLTQKRGFPQLFHDIYHIQKNAGHGMDGFVGLSLQNAEGYHSAFYERLWRELKFGADHVDVSPLARLVHKDPVYASFHRVYTELLMCRAGARGSALYQPVGIMKYEPVSLSDHALLILGLKIHTGLMRYIQFEKQSRNRRLLLAAARHDPVVLKKAHKSLLNDRDFIREVLSVNGNALMFLGKHHMADAELVLIAKKQCATVPIHPTLMNNQSFVISALEQQLLSFQHLIDYEITIDEEIMFAAVRGDPMNLEFCFHSTLRCDCPQYVELVRLAVRGNAESFQFASDDLKSDQEFIASLFAYPGAEGIMPWVPMDLRDDAEFMCDILKQAHGLEALNYSGEYLREDKDFALRCVRIDARVLDYFDKQIQMDCEVECEAAAAQGL